MSILILKQVVKSYQILEQPFMVYNIQKYCKTNTFDSNNIPAYIKFMQKFRKTIRSLNSRLDYIDYHDFEFRVNYKEERQLNKENRLLSKYFKQLG